MTFYQFISNCLWQDHFRSRRAVDVKLPKLKLADFKWVTPPEVADETQDEEVRRLATEFGEEEQEDTEALDQILAQTQRAH